MTREDQLKHQERKLEKLNQLVQKMKQTRGYSRSVGELKFLEELVREQGQYENSRHSTRTTR